MERKNESSQWNVYKVGLVEKKIIIGFYGNHNITIYHLKIRICYNCMSFIQKKSNSGRRRVCEQKIWDILSHGFTKILGKPTYIAKATKQMVDILPSSHITHMPGGAVINYCSEWSLTIIITTPYTPYSLSS